MGINSRVSCGLAWVCLLLAGNVSAQHYEVLRQQLDANRHGYTVIRVWGTHRQMGRALGEAFAVDILAGLAEIKGDLGALYDTARTVIGDCDWSAEGILDELQGMAEGILSVNPQAEVDQYDLMVANTYGDWGYYGGCRSHQCWGSFVEGATRSLSTRRLDFGTPFDMVLHHALIAFDPAGGGMRWVNLAWPGYVAVITGVNASGTLVSLHDYGTDFRIISGGMLRCVATRRVLTEVPAGLPLTQHLGWAENMLNAATFTTGTFINYYVPEGLGGVFTCTTGGSCGPARKPQAAYFDGEVLITTNSQTTGTSVPSGGEFMDEYYRQGKPKHLADHFELMGTSGLHLLSVDYRGREDMTLWFHGRGLQSRVEVEWSQLFPTGPVQDGGDGGADAGQDAGADVVPDGGQPADTGQTDADQPGGGCGCMASPTGQTGPMGTISLLLLMVVVLRRFW